MFEHFYFKQILNMNNFIFEHFFVWTFLCLNIFFKFEYFLEIAKIWILFRFKQFLNWTILEFEQLSNLNNFQI
jgi:hypothetical protein